MFTRLKRWVHDLVLDIRGKRQDGRWEEKSNRRGSGFGAQLEGPVFPADGSTAAEKEPPRPAWEELKLEGFRGALPMALVTESSEGGEPDVCLRVPVADLMAGKTRGSVVLAQLSFLSGGKQSMEGPWAPARPWCPQAPKRVATKYQHRGYRQVWALEQTTEYPRRPYQLRLDLARIQPAGLVPVEEMLKNRHLPPSKPLQEPIEKVEVTLLAPGMDVDLNVPVLEHPSRLLEITREVLSGFKEPISIPELSTGPGVRVPLSSAEAELGERGFSEADVTGGGDDG